jgi:two-component system, OmpR family, sensor histidine kinase BaeS
MSSPETAAGTFRERVTSWVTTPWRLFEERTGVQLVASYVAVVLLVIVLFEITVMVSLLWSPGATPFGADDSLIDPYLGERAGAYVQWLDPDEINAVVNGPPPTRAEIEALGGRLDMVASGRVPGFSGLTPISTGDETTLVLVTDTSGIVVAASHNALLPRQSINDLPSETLIATARRNLALAGEVDTQWNALYSLGASEGHTAVAHPIITDSGDWVGTLIMQGDAASAGIAGPRTEVFRNISLMFLQSLWIFAIPAVIVAVPFGIWRTRSLTRRLQRLAGAAEAMAAGNLHTRVRIQRRDEIGRLAESFNAMAEHIDQYDQSRRAFISNISHELRTPVSIIKGTAERLQLGPHGQDPEIAEALSVIQHEGDMLVRLTDDLFTLARLEEHNLRLLRRPVTLHTVTEDVVSGVAPIAWSERKVSVENLVSAELPAVYADAQRLRQIVSNLIYNALRHTPEGGLVVIQAKRAGGGVLEVMISDTGLGMDEETQANVFDRYYQAEQSRRHGEGSGLGLSVVQQLVNAHGGEIVVESQVNKGTTFRFTMPIAT